MNNEISFELDEEEYSLPAIWEICSRCRGNGKHGNPNIDGNGITSEEFAEWSEDERETYLTGGYDVTCEDGCQDGKVLVVAPDEQLTPAQRELAARYQKQQRQIAQWDAEDAHTRFMENGGRE